MFLKTLSYSNINLLYEQFHNCIQDIQLAISDLSFTKKINQEMHFGN